MTAPSAIDAHPEFADRRHRLDADYGVGGVYHAEWSDHPWIDQADAAAAARDQFSVDALCRGGRKEIMLCTGCMAIATQPPDEPCYSCGGYGDGMVPFGPEQVVVGEVSRARSKR